MPSPSPIRTDAPTFVHAPEHHRPAQLPCLSSHPDCLQHLSQRAIARSPEITAIDDRLDLVGQQIGLQYDRRWTAFLPLIPIGPTGFDLSKLNPMQWVSTLFGGGSVREVDVKIAELELRVSDLLRRRAELMNAIAQDITQLVLTHEKLARQHQLLNSQLLTQQQRQAVLEVRYRVGAGSTLEMLGTWEKLELMQSRQIELQLDQQQIEDKLKLLCCRKPVEPNPDH